MQLQLGQTTQFENSIAFFISDESDDGQALRKCLLKLEAVLQLNGHSTIPSGIGGFPLVDGCRNLNLFFNDERCGRAAFQNSLNMRRIEPSLRDQAIRRKPTLQSR